MMVLKRLGSRFLNAEDVADGDVVTITAEPRFVSKAESEFGKERYVVAVELEDKATRDWSMNNTTWNRLLQAFGNSEKEWVGKRIMVRIKEQVVNGADKKVLYGYPYVEQKPK